MEHERKHCVLCDSNITPFAQFKHPMYECVDATQKNDVWDIQYGHCEVCYSVQLTKLADPAILYNKHYFQPLNHTYLWIQHNISFVKFIIDHYDCDVHKSILEIGSSSFCLGRHLLPYYNDYTVFDFSLENAKQLENVKYLEGNCETYRFESPTLVMSHVFEHLYEPKKFIQNCLKSNVKNIFISVPSMDAPDQFHISIQHTFMYNQRDIEFMFGLYNYKLTSSLPWDSIDTSFPCYFFHFTLQEQPIRVEPCVQLRHLYSVQFLTQSIRVPKNTFLATCSPFSMITYEFISNKEDILGVIDYNKDKQGKKFSYTDLWVYPYEHLYLCTDASILVIHPKKNNIVKMIQSMNTNVHII
jgi:hypothetical protein